MMTLKFELVLFCSYFKSLMNYKFVDTHTVPFCWQVDNKKSHFLICYAVILDLLLFSGSPRFGICAAVAVVGTVRI